jgi:hypothetical protein
MIIYELDDRGEKISHSYHHPQTAGWAVIHLLAKSGSASRDKILTYVPDATPTLLAKLEHSRFIRSTKGVSI